jgi:TATA-box binding protein (TBP) (component of TFIID and TFIIIB)
MLNTPKKKPHPSSSSHNKSTPKFIPPEEVDEEWVKKENIVLTLKTSSAVYLPSISCLKPQLTLINPDASGYMVLRHLTPYLMRISTNLFSSGKMVITGSKNVFDAFSCIYVTLRMIREATGKKDYHGTCLSLRNIVMTVTLPTGVDITALSEDILNKKYVVLDRTRFPGAIMSLPDQTPTANIFDSGKFVLPGPCTKDHAMKCVSWVYKRIRPYLCDNLKKRKVGNRKKESQSFGGCNVGKSRKVDNDYSEGFNNAENEWEEEGYEEFENDEDELALQRLEQEICEMENLL